VEEILLDAYIQKIERPKEAVAGAAIIKGRHTPNPEYKVQRKEVLGLYTVVNLGPRGSKSKVLKIERN